jgi:hypothetical protein
MVGQFVIGEIPSIHWEDSQGFFRFDSEEEALESLNDIYFQLFSQPRLESNLEPDGFRRGQKLPSLFE